MTQPMPSNILDAIAQAQQSAAQSVLNQAGALAPLPAATPPQAGLPAVPARRITREDFQTGQMSVEAWLKATPHGVTVGTNPDLIRAVRVVLDMTEVVWKKSVTLPGGTTYYHTVDNHLCTDGVTLWAKAVEMARPNRPYNSADLPMVLTADAAGMSGQVVAPAGTRVGYSLSWSSGREFDLCLKDAAKAVPGLDVDRALIEIEIGGKGAVSKDKKTYSHLTFKFLGLYQPV